MADDLAALTAARVATTGARLEYTPDLPAERSGGDLDASGTLARVLPAARSGKEVMLLCVGGEGSMRMGANLVLNLASLGLRHMLLFAPKQEVCDGVWEVLPRVACVWQPSAFASKRPASLYNDAMRLFGMREFNPVALDFFRARKRLLVQLVLSHGLNVLHLDADVAVLANPYPLFKGPLLEHQLIFQTDNPFANAGVFYVQGVARGSGGAWLLEELNARIERFTFRPESVRELPHSGWSAPPHFANADEQANLNDVIASALIGERTFAAGVEFFEARFKAQFAPGHCWKAGAASYGSAECVSAREGKQRLGSPRYQAETHRARRSLRGGGGAGGGGRGALRKVAHLCRGGGGGGGGSRVGSLGVPGNVSAPRSSLYLASESTFSHFPYGAFFPQMRGCHDASWRWEARSELERRMCAPEHRVPCLLVHMAGLRQEQWGRRALLRSLKIWRPEADAVAPAAWLSPRAFAAAGARSPEERRRAWGGEAAGRLLVTEGVRTSFASMGEYDRFAARLLLLGLLLRRRVVMPPIPCELKWMQRALEPRHLRGMDVGCGDQRQCIWLPYPHHIDPWCAGIDYLNDIDYRDLLARRLVVAPTAGATLSAGDLKLARNGSGPAVRLASGAPPPDEPQVLLMRAPAGGTSDPFEAWLPLGGFKGRKWQAPLPVLVNAALRAPPPAGFGASDAQMKIVQDCMRSLATSRE